MPTVPKIMKSAVDAMAPAVGKPTFLWDAALPGFGVKCSPAGVKRYIVKYRTSGGGRSAPQRWLTLGGHGQLTPDQARRLAQQALAAVARGEDPQGARSELRSAATLTDVWQRFEAEHLPSLKAQTRYDYQGQWNNVLQPALGNAPVHQITRSEIDRLHKKLQPTPYKANRVVALLSRLMTLAEKWELRPTGSNPCRHIDRFKEKPRTRYLSGDELKALGSAMATMVEQKELSQQAAHAIQLLLLTGARLSEILSAEWTWVDTKHGVTNCRTARQVRSRCSSAGLLLECSSAKPQFRGVTSSSFLALVGV